MLSLRLATIRARDGNRQIRVRSNTSGGGGVELGTQVLQVVAINGYPVVTRNGKFCFFPFGFQKSIIRHGAQLYVNRAFL